MGNRWIEKRLKESLERFPVTCLMGAPRTGKTTLLRSLVLPNANFLSLDDEKVCSAASEDPTSFLKAFSNGTLIIDGIHKVPGLLQAVIRNALEDPIPGRFLLSSSFDFRRLPQIRPTVPETAGFVRLRGLSAAERIGSHPYFLKKVLAGDIRFGIRKEESGRRWLVEEILKGGFPEVLEDEETFPRPRLESVLHQLILEIRQVRGFKKGSS